MQYYVEFEENGNIRTFYDDRIHVITETAIPITVEQWQTYSADARLYKRSGSGDEPCRLKMQEELDAEAAAQPQAPKSPDQQRLDLIQAALDDLILGGTL